MEVKLKYKIGEKLKFNDRLVTVIGFDYIEGRGVRYALLWIDGKPTWEYLHDFEIDALLSL